MAVILAALSSLLYGVGDFTGGLASRKISVFSVVFFSQTFGVSAALLFLLLTHSQIPLLQDLVLGAAAGIFGSAGLLLLYKGLAETQAAVISPTSGVVGTVIPTLFGLLLGEMPSTTLWIGYILCIPAIVFLAYERSSGSLKTGVNRALLLGFLAGLGFGAFFIVISRTGKDAGIWPLFAARITSLGMIFLTVKARRQKLKSGRALLPLLLLTGLSDMGANIAFLLASRRGMLILVSIVSSLYPAPTVLLARIILKQKLGPLKIAGLLLACAGIAFISLG